MSVQPAPAAPAAQPGAPQDPYRAYNFKFEINGTVQGALRPDRRPRLQAGTHPLPRRRGTRPGAVHPGPGRVPAGDPALRAHRLQRDGPVAVPGRRGHGWSGSTCPSPCWTTPSSREVRRWNLIAAWPLRVARRPTGRARQRPGDRVPHAGLRPAGAGRCHGSGGVAGCPRCCGPPPSGSEPEPPPADDDRGAPDFWLERARTGRPVGTGDPPVGQGKPAPAPRRSRSEPGGDGSRVRRPRRGAAAGRPSSAPGVIPAPPISAGGTARRSRARSGAGKRSAPTLRDGSLASSRPSAGDGAWRPPPPGRRHVPLQRARPTRPSQASPGAERHQGSGFRGRCRHQRANPRPGGCRQRSRPCTSRCRPRTCPAEPPQHRNRCRRTTKWTQTSDSGGSGPPWR